MRGRFIHSAVVQPFRLSDRRNGYTTAGSWLIYACVACRGESFRLGKRNEVLSHIYVVSIGEKLISRKQPVRASGRYICSADRYSPIAMMENSARGDAHRRVN